MNATVPPEPAFGGAAVGAPKVLRSPGSCFGWLLLSFGLWGFAWIHDNLSEVGGALGRDTQPTLKTVLYIVPIVNIFVLYFTWKDVNEFIESTGENGFSPILYVILNFIPIVNIFIYISVQSKLNAGWMRGTNGTAQPAELSSLGKILVIVGAVFWAIYLLIIIVAVVS